MQLEGALPVEMMSEQGPRSDWCSLLLGAHYSSTVGAWAVQRAQG